MRQTLELIAPSLNCINKLEKSTSFLSSRKVVVITVACMIATLYFTLKSQNNLPTTALLEDDLSDGDTMSIVTSASSVSIDTHPQTINLPPITATPPPLASPQTLLLRDLEANLQRINQGLRTVAVCTKGINSHFFVFYRSILICNYLITNRALNQVWKNICKGQSPEPVGHRNPSPSRERLDTHNLEKSSASSEESPPLYGGVIPFRGSFKIMSHL